MKGKVLVHFDIIVGSAMCNDLFSERGGGDKGKVWKRIRISNIVVDRDTQREEEMCRKIFWDKELKGTDVFKRVWEKREKGREERERDGDCTISENQRMYLNLAPGVWTRLSVYQLVDDANGRYFCENIPKSDGGFAFQILCNSALLTVIQILNNLEHYLSFIGTCICLEADVGWTTVDILAFKNSLYWAPATLFSSDWS